MWQPNRKPIEVKKHSSCSEGMWITASRTGAQYMKNAQTATVASSCIETSAKTLRRKPWRTDASAAWTE